MDYLGSFFNTVLERTRAYLDDASLDAKYDDNFLARNIISPAFASIASRINNSTTNSISNWMPFPIKKGVAYYVLPPCVGEIWRLGTRTDDFRVDREAMPRTEWHYRGPNWKVEGNMLVFNPAPDQDYDDLELQYVHNGEISPFRSAGFVLSGLLSSINITSTQGDFSCNAADLVTGNTVYVTGTNTGTGSISGYSPFGSMYYIVSTDGSTTFRLSNSYGGSPITTTVGTWLSATMTTNANSLTFLDGSTPLIGTVDRREGSYVGSVFRMLGTPGGNPVEERVISGFKLVGTSWQVDLARPFSRIPGGSQNIGYEIAPFGLESLYEAVAIAGALKMSIYKQAKPAFFQMLQLQYKDAMKTAMDHFSNKQMRTGKYFERNTADNKLNDWRNI